MQQDSPHTQQLSSLAPNLIDQLNPKHPRLSLAKRIPWDYVETEFAPLYAHIGRPAKPIWLMVGLCILKRLENLSGSAWCNCGFKIPTINSFAEK